MVTLYKSQGFKSPSACSRRGTTPRLLFWTLFLYSFFIFLKYFFLKGIKGKGGGICVPETPLACLAPNSLATDGRIRINLT